jgi:hypothetical protein
MTEYEYYKEAAGILEDIECMEDDIKSISKLAIGTEITVAETIPIQLTEEIRHAFTLQLKERIKARRIELSTLKTTYKILDNGTE